jgi:hypothetical protein
VLCQGSQASNRRAAAVGAAVFVGAAYESGEGKDPTRVHDGLRVLRVGRAHSFEGGEHVSYEARRVHRAVTKMCLQK